MFGFREKVESEIEEIVSMDEIISNQKQTIHQLEEKLALQKTRIQFTDIASLTDALIRAKDAHGQFERGLGRPDQNWPSWYAGFIALEQGLAVSSSLVPRPSCSGPTCLVKPQATKAAEIPEGVGKSGPEEWDRGSQEYWNVHS